MRRLVDAPVKEARVQDSREARGDLTADRAILDGGRFKQGVLVRPIAGRHQISDSSERTHNNQWPNASELHGHAVLLAPRASPHSPPRPVPPLWPQAHENS